MGKFTYLGHWILPVVVDCCTAS